LRRRLLRTPDVALQWTPATGRVFKKALSLCGGVIASRFDGRYGKAMSTLQDIREAVGKLPAEDLAAFRAWFGEFDAAQWDRQFAEDVAAGRLDDLAEEALRDLHEGRCTDP